ncbi:P-loop containing nucleoside triphosphate hydrolase protein [Amanita muscaria]
MVDPNVSTFQNAQNVTITGGEITTVGGNYTKTVYVTSNVPSPAQIPPLPPFRSPSTFFTGRDSYLQALKDHFSPNLDSERKKFLLYGMGGIGKTQICLKFIEKYGKKCNYVRFSDIFWIDASSEHTVDLCLRQIAQKNKLDSTPSAESALEWISDRNDWLMVFDNADGGYKVVEKFIPSGNGGGILITSRNKALTRITSGTHSLEVTELEEEEAIALLLKSAGVDCSSVNVAIAAEKLVAELGCIPLAIDQAGAYVQSCDCGLDYYLELFMKHRAKLMQDKEFTGASLYKYSTYGTWEISIEEIKHRAEGEGNAQRLAAESALILHNIFAFLHHDNISGEIFEKAAVNFMERRGEKTNASLPQSISWLDSKTLFLNEDGNWDVLQFQAGIRVLMSFSLIRKHEMLYSVHPLIQAWSRDRIPVTNVSDHCQRSRSILACSLKLHEEDNYKFWNLLQPMYTQSYTRQNKERSSLRATKRQEVSEFGLYFHQTDEPSTTMVLLS